MGSRLPFTENETSFAKCFLVAAKSHFATNKKHNFLFRGLRLCKTTTYQIIFREEESSHLMFHTRN